MRKLIKNKKGFTLTESVIVLVIVAILAAISIPTYMGFVENAKTNAISAEARIVYVAAQAYVTEQVAAGTTDISKLVPRLLGKKDAEDADIEGGTNPGPLTLASHVLSKYVGETADAQGTITAVEIDNSTSGTATAGKITALTYVESAGKYKATLSGGKFTFSKVS